MSMKGVRTRSFFAWKPLLKRACGGKGRGNYPAVGLLAMILLAQKDLFSGQPIYTAIGRGFGTATGRATRWAVLLGTPVSC